MQSWACLLHLYITLVSGLFCWQEFEKDEQEKREKSSQKQKERSKKEEKKERVEERSRTRDKERSKRSEDRERGRDSEDRRERYVFPLSGLLCQFHTHLYSFN